MTNAPEVAITQNIQPAPSTYSKTLLGLTFGKLSPYNYLTNCDTIEGPFDSSVDCRWADCGYPRRLNAQQTVAIYVR